MILDRRAAPESKAPQDNEVFLALQEPRDKRVILVSEEHLALRAALVKLALLDP